jgi:nicotinamide-nucleotide amidase
MDAADEVAEQIAKILKDRGESVAVAESSAAGLISAALVGVAGASAYYKGSALTYTGDGIQRLIGLTPEDLSKEPPGTGERSLLVARGVREKLGATWSIAESGATGPTGSRYGYSAGHAALAVSGPVEKTAVVETRSSNRRENMKMFALAALELLLEALKAAK